jgi:putative FmdB family regulatory protein
MTFTIRERGTSTGLLMADYRCPECGDFEALIERPTPDHQDCPICGAESDWVISAPHPKVLSVPCSAVVRGGDTERRPGMLDTRPLAEGMSITEWRKVQKKHSEERRHEQMVKKGLKTKRIQVG